jgi:hypothetical protein
VATPGRVGFLVSLALLAIGLLAASGASAAYLHPTVTDSFGPDGTSGSTFGTATKLAFNQAEQRLYLLDGSNSAPRIDAFDTSTPGVYTPVGGNFPLTVLAPTGGASFNELATDDTTLGSAGNLYYLDGGSGTFGGTFGFDSTGTALGGGFPIPQSSNGNSWGVAVDGEGHVWITDSTNKAVNEYTASGTLARTVIDTSAAPEGPRQIAFDRSNDNLYISTFNSVYEFFAASGYTSHVEIESGTGVSSLTVDSKTHTLYVAHSFPASVTAYNSSGALLETLSTPNGLEGVAVDESTGTVYAAATANNQVSVIPGVIVPDVTTGGETGAATINGHVDPASGGNVTTCYFDWGTDTSYSGGQAPCSQTTPIGTASDVSADLSAEVTSETTYHYRLVAGNANGLNYGPDETFTTHDVIGLNTDAASGIDKTDATLNAHFIGNGQETTYHFEWGTSPGTYTSQSTPESVTPADGEAQSLSYAVSGLEPGTTYYYRVAAANTVGTSNSDEASFTTAKAVADLATQPPTDLTATSATLNGSWTGEAGLDTSCHFEWGPSTSYGSSTPVVDEGSNTGSQTASAPVEGLRTLTTYHYRIACHNDAFGDAYGQDELVTTLLAPTVAVLPPTEYTVPKAAEPTAGVTLEATVNPQRGGDTTYHFDYGTSESYGSSTPESASVGGDGHTYPASAKLTGLEPGVTYHYRFVATSTAGRSESIDQTFTTVPLPATVAASSASGVTPTTATLSATVEPGFGATVVAFDYGTDTSYGRQTLYSDPTPPDNAAHAVSAQLSGLIPGTTYHYRAVAVNFNGVTDGPDQTFATPALPAAGGSTPAASPPPPLVTPIVEVIPPPKRHCKKPLVKRHGKCVRRKKPRHHRKKHHAKRHGKKHHPKNRHGGRHG